MNLNLSLNNQNNQDNLPVKIVNSNVQFIFMIPFTLPGLSNRPSSCNPKHIILIFYSFLTIWTWHRDCKTSVGRKLCRRKGERGGQGLVKKAKNLSLEQNQNEVWLLFIQQFSTSLHKGNRTSVEIFPIEILICYCTNMTCLNPIG